MCVQHRRHQVDDQVLQESHLPHGEGASARHVVYGGDYAVEKEWLLLMHESAHTQSRIWQQCLCV